MDSHAAPSPAPQTGTAIWKKGFASTSATFGFFSLCVFWWYPFGLCLATVGFVVGLIANLLNIKSEADGDTDNLPLFGMCLAGISMSLILTLKFGIYFFLDN